MYQALLTVRHGVKLPSVLLEHTFSFDPKVHIGHPHHEMRACKGPKSVSRIALHVWTRGSVDYVAAPIDCFHLYDMVGNP